VEDRHVLVCLAPRPVHHHLVENAIVSTERVGKPRTVGAHWVPPPETKVADLHKRQGEKTVVEAEVFSRRTLRAVTEVTAEVLRRRPHRKKGGEEGTTPERATQYLRGGQSHSESHNIQVHTSPS